MNIVVLAGGLSTERDVSFKTGSMVAKALKENGHKVILLDVFMGYSDREEDLTGIFDRADEISVQVSDIPTEAPDLAKVKASRKDQSPCFFGPNVIKMCQMADIVFMALHGENGENGKIQAAFDLFGVKYTGSDYLSSAIAMNKETSKQFFLANGIPTPKGISMTRATRQADITKLDLTLPCVVKPCCGGSSIGVTIVRDAAEFKAALDDAFKWENELVIEEFVQGREFSVGVIEGKALPIIEIAPKEGFYDYKNKYKAGSTVETCPAELPEQVTNAQLRRGALQRSDLLPVLLQQPVDRGDVGIDLLDRTAHPFVIARERDEVFARTDPRQILGDGIDVGEDDLDERILRTNHRFERIALHHGLFGHPAAHARYECTCGTEYRQANVFHHFRWFDCHNGVKDKQKSGRLYEKNAPAAASGIKIVRRMADSRRPACGIRLKSAIFGRRLRYSRSAMFE